MWRELRRAWAKVLIHDGFTDLGEDLLQAAKDDQPGSAEDAFDLAQIALEQRDLPRAITLLRECLTHNPTHLAARETLTSLLNLGFR
jgi:thioredoxin-like negative regulator of GroEL